MYIRKAIEVGRLISGWKQVSVHLVSDDPTYLEIPKGFFNLILVVRSCVSF